MTLEPNGNADIQHSETEYLMDIGKGVLLANAKLKLLDEFLDKTSSELSSSVLSQLGTMGADISKSISALDASATKDSCELARKMDHLDTQLSQVAASSSAKVVGLISALSGRSQENSAQMQRDICSAVAEASVQLAKKNEEVSGKILAEILRTKEAVIASEQANCRYMRELVSNFEGRSQESRDGIAKVFAQRTGSLRRWLICLTLLTVLLSGSCVAMLVLQILK